MLRTLAFHTLSYAARSSAQSGGIAGFGVALYRRGLSLLTRLALGGMLAAIAAILIGAVATGGGLVQLLVTAFAAFALWIPAFLLVFVNYDLGHYKDARKWVEVVRTQYPDQYRNVRHMETMMPREE